MKRIRLLMPILLAMPVLVAAQQPLGNTGSDFTYQKLVRIAERLVNFLLQLAELAVVGAIIWYGLQMVISKGDATKFAKAKKGLGLSILGAVVIFGVYTIIATLRGGVESVGQ
jgi:TRAP-type C4-dicarboxylate transport system permease small subunit